MSNEGSLALQEEPMAEAAGGESYKAFKARARLEFRSRHAGRAQAVQQRLLRLRLRHFLLTVGAAVDQKQRPQGTEDDVVNHEAHAGINFDGDISAHTFAVEQKRLAVAREAARAKRHRSARALQRFFRHCRSLMLRDEQELLSTSVLVAMVTEQPAATRATTTAIGPPADVDSSLIRRPAMAPLPPFEVVVELVAARGLALGAATAVAFDGKYVEAELLLKRRSDVIARATSTRQFVPAFQDSSTEMQLQDCALRFAVDPHNDTQLGVPSPQSVIDEWSATVVVKAAGTTLGVVGIPLSLLDTPLASQCALCRWFPLEKAYPGHAVRGDLRVNACFLMRQSNPDGITMVPYVNAASPPNPDDAAPILQERKKPVARRLRNTPTERKPRSKTSQRKRVLQSSEPQAHKSERPESQGRSLKDSMSSPMGRISRAEALSPPSSPSSIASSEAGETMAESPIPQRQASTSRRPTPASKRQEACKPRELSAPEEEEAQTKASSPRAPAKSFLKRKPGKVVFHKLDWSGVSSKTDSNLPTSGNSHANSGAASRTASRAAARASSATTQSSNSGGDDARTTSSPGAFIDARTAERLAALEAAVYERCCVTRESASLARFKYQKERSKFAATLQGQKQRPGTEGDHPSSQESGSNTVDSAVTELWRRLTGDSSGELYAATLRGLLERPARPKEPSLTQIGNFNVQP
jgi:hypothetical protein